MIREALNIARTAVLATALALKSAARMRWSGYGGQSYGQAGGSLAFGARIRAILPGAHRDYEADAGQLWRNSAIAACLGWLRKNFPEPTLKVMVRQGTEWIENAEHPVLEWLEEPNEDYDADALWAATILSLKVDGNAYWLRGKAPDGRQGFWYVPHWQMNPRWPTDGSTFISHYEMIVDGKRTIMNKEYVIHFREGMDPDNERLGMAELKTALREICADNEANTYVASVIRNMGIVGLVISPESKEDTIEEDERDNLKSLISRRTGERRGEPIVNSVPLRLQEYGATPEKMALDKIRKVPEARILACIGLPGMVVGLSVGDDQKTYRNLSEANRHAYENCLIPLQKSLAKQLQRQLKPALQGRRVERLVWDYSEVQSLREDATETAKRVVIEFQGGLITKDEGRASLGRKPAQDGNGGVYCTLPLKGSIPAIGDNRINGEAT